LTQASGYFATAKFDPARKAPFEPLLRLMTSLFRQIFSEADVSTNFHTNLRRYLQSTGVWTVLRTYLDLPDWLLNTGSALKTPQQRGMDMTRDSNDRRVSSPAIHCGASGHTAEAWLGGASKSSQFSNVFLDVLRFIATNSKLCIWCLEDVQNADIESGELIQHIVQAKIPIVLIFTYVDEPTLPQELRSLVCQYKFSTPLHFKIFASFQNYPAFEHLRHTTLTTGWHIRSHATGVWKIHAFVRGATAGYLALTPSSLLCMLLE
jgi:hypothetical protein